MDDRSTDYGHTMAKSKFKSQYQINIWVFDIKAYFCAKIIEHGHGTHCTKMGADKSAENTKPKCPKIYLPKLSTQNFGIVMKKGFIGRPKSVNRSMLYGHFFFL